MRKLRLRDVRWISQRSHWKSWQNRKPVIAQHYPLLLLTKILFLTKLFRHSCSLFSILARVFLCRFNQNPPILNIWSPMISNWVSYSPAPLLNLQAISDHPGLSSARIVLGWFSKDLLLPLMFPSSKFLSTDPHPAQAVFRVEPNLFPPAVTTQSGPYTYLHSPPLNEVCFPSWTIVMNDFSLTPSIGLGF